MRRAAIALSLIFGFGAFGCGSDEAEEDETCTVDESYAPVIAPADFVAVVDNPLHPLPVGRKWTYKEGIEDIVVEVTPDTKLILGVTCTVVRDTVSANGVTLEDTFDWYAQDKDGQVWYFGEDTTEFADGKPVSKEGSWESGVDGAQPGIIIPKSPAVGMKYRQEYLACEAEDMGEIIATDVSVTVPQGSHTGCLRTRDTTPLDPEVLEEKTYCPSVGFVLAEDKTTGTKEELIKMEGP